MLEYRGMLLYLLIPLGGLVLGALLPPFLVAWSRWVALTLNIAGFLLYFLPLVLVCGINMDSALPPEQRTTPEEYLQLLLVVAAVFFSLEVAACLLWWLGRALRRRLSALPHSR